MLHPASLSVGSSLEGAMAAEETEKILPETEKILPEAPEEALVSLIGAWLPEP